MKEQFYQIAGLTLCVQCVPVESVDFDNYLPFELPTGKYPLIFTMRSGILQHPAGTPAICYNQDGADYAIYLQDDTCDILFKPEGAVKGYHMHASGQWSDIIVDIDFSTSESLYVLNNFIMFAYIYSAAYHNTVQIHSSCVRYGNCGVAFMGPSGIGKSTHSRLWIEHVEGAQLLNDDQPAVRILDGKPYIFGTPWSGKENCYKNEGVLLDTIFIMEQSPHNEAIPCSSVELFEQLLVSCSLMREDMQTFNRITQTLSSIARDTKSFRLKCRPDQAAAELSFKKTTT